jgi:hypothetical protein
MSVEPAPRVLKRAFKREDLIQAKRVVGEACRELGLDPDVSVLASPERFCA